MLVPVGRLLPTISEWSGGRARQPPRNTAARHTTTRTRRKDKRRPVSTRECSATLIIRFAMDTTSSARNTFESQYGAARQNRLRLCRSLRLLGRRSETFLDFYFSS